MIERKFVAEKLKEFQIQEYVNESLKGTGQSHTKLQRTPLGEKIIIFASKPGLVVGRSGENIKKLTKVLKKKFGLENPQIEISEVDNINLDANIVAEMIAISLERFGSAKFKAIGHKAMENVMNAGALGVEIIMSGKIPSSRAKSWRFYQGYLKKCGDSVLKGIKVSYKSANLKSGTIGVQVRIMPPDMPIVDSIIVKKENEITEKIVEEQKKEEPQDNKKKRTRGEGKRKVKSNAQKSKNVGAVESPAEKKEEIAQEEIKDESNQ